MLRLPSACFSVNTSLFRGITATFLTPFCWNLMRQNSVSCKFCRSLVCLRHLFASGLEWDCGFKSDKDLLTALIQINNDYSDIVCIRCEQQQAGIARSIKSSCVITHPVTPHWLSTRKHRVPCEEARDFIREPVDRDWQERRLTNTLHLLYSRRPAFAHETNWCIVKQMTFGPSL